MHALVTRARLAVARQCAALASTPRAASRHGAVQQEHREQADQDDGEGAQRGAFELLAAGVAVDVGGERLEVEG